MSRPLQQLVSRVFPSSGGEPCFRQGSAIHRDGARRFDQDRHVRMARRFGFSKNSPPLMMGMAALRSTDGLTNLNRFGHGLPRACPVLQSRNRDVTGHVGGNGDHHGGSCRLTTLCIWTFPAEFSKKARCVVGVVLNEVQCTSIVKDVFRWKPGPQCCSFIER